VLGNSVKSEDKSVQRFPGIRTKHLKRVVENRDLGSPDTFVVHIGTNEYIMGDVYALANVAKTKFPHSKLIVSGVFRRRDVTWRRIGGLDARYDWIAKTLGVTQPDRELGLHLNQSGARILSHLCSRVCGFGADNLNRMSGCCWLLTVKGPGVVRGAVPEEHSTLVWPTTTRE
jgi:hypothetical protein